MADLHCYVFGSIAIERNYSKNGVLVGYEYYPIESENAKMAASQSKILLFQVVDTIATKL